MYVSEVIAIPIIMQSTLSNPKAIKFRSNKNSNTIIKSIFCRKNRATSQNLKKMKE